MHGGRQKSTYYLLVDCSAGGTRTYNQWINGLMGLPTRPTSIRTGEMMIRRALLNPLRGRSVDRSSDIREEFVLPSWSRSRRRGFVLSMSLRRSWNGTELVDDAHVETIISRMLSPSSSITSRPRERKVATRVGGGCSARLPIFSLRGSRPPPRRSCPDGSRGSSGQRRSKQRDARSGLGQQHPSATRHPLRRELTPGTQPVPDLATSPHRGC